MLAVGTADGRLRVVDLDSGRDIFFAQIASEAAAAAHAVAQHGAEVWAVAMSPNGGVVAAACEDHSWQTLDVLSGQPLFRNDGHTGRGGCTCVTDRWGDIEEVHAMCPLNGHSAGIRAITYSPCGQYLATGGEDKAAMVWNAQTGAMGRALQNPNAVCCIAFVGLDAGRLASGCEDGSIHLWDIESGAILQTLAHYPSVLSLCVAPDGRRLASGGGGAALRVWAIDRAEPLRIEGGHDGSAPCVAFSPDGRILASGGEDCCIVLWDAGGSGERLVLQGHNGQMPCLCRERGNDSVFIKHPECEVVGHASFVQSVAFSPDGRALVSGSADGTYKVWETATGAHLHTFDAGAKVYSVAFARGGHNR